MPLTRPHRDHIATTPNNYKFVLTSNVIFMKVIPILPIDSISGKLYGKDSFYFRKSRNGKIYACRCPDRSKHIKTKAEAENQLRFAQQYAKKSI